MGQFVPPPAPPALPNTSLIVCSRNRPDLLVGAIESILSGNELPTEIIVIDQSDVPHPTLATRACRDNCEIRYHHTRSVGLSRANNAGVAASRHDILVFTHDDVFVAPDWFGTIVRAALAAGPRGVVTGKVLPTDAEVRHGFVLTLKTDDTPAVYEGRIGKDVLFPLNMAMHRTAIEAVRGFDERLGPGTPFPAAEDNDIGFRLLEAGYRILYVPAAVLYHRAWRSNYLALQWAYGRGSGAYYAKHFSLHDRHMILLTQLDVAYRVRHGIRRVLRATYSLIADFLYICGLLSGMAEWFLKYRGRRDSVRGHREGIISP